VSDRKSEVKRAVSIIGSFLFGSAKELEAQAEELSEAVEEKVEEVRRRRRIGLPPGRGDP
jgi:hypothetical protein